MDRIRPAIVLFVLTLVSGLLLGGVDFITRDAIEAQEEQTYFGNLYDIFSEDYIYEEMETAEDKIYGCYKVYDSDDLKGYVIETRPLGYGGEIRLLTGVSLNGSIKKVRILSMSETPGLGAHAKDDKFLSLYDEKAGNLKVSKLAEKENEIQAITSATITSNAITEGVNASVAFFENNLRELIEN